MPRPGVTAVLVAVPELDPLLTAVAARWPGAVRPGIPAHLTVLYPFLDVADVTAVVVERCRELCAAAAPVTVAFEDVVVWSEIVATAPSPAGPIAALTRSFAAAFPSHPPYGGRFGPDPQPHVTLATEPVAEIAARTRPLLPARAELSGALLVELTDSGWTQLADLPFHGGR